MLRKIRAMDATGWSRRPPTLAGSIFRNNGAKRGANAGDVDWLRNENYGTWGAGQQRLLLPSPEIHNMMASLLEPLFRRVREEIARDATWRKEEADRQWDIVMVLHREQTEARSLIEEAPRECRDQARTGTSRHHRAA